MNIRRKFNSIILALCLLMNIEPDNSIFAETYEYDNLGRVIKTTYDNGQYVCYEYDANGNIIKITTSDTIFDNNHIYLSKAFAQVNVETKDAIRFVTSIDSLDYSEIGFFMSIDNEVPTAENNSIRFRLKTTYNELYVNDEVITIDDLKTLNGSSPNGNYLFSFTIVNITDKDVKIYATPYAVDCKGSMIYGQTSGFSVNDLIVKEEKE